MFDIDKFIQDCDSRIEKKNNHKAVIDILARAVENPTDLFNHFGEPTQGGIQKIYQSEKFSILNVVSHFYHQTNQKCMTGKGPLVRCIY